MEPCETQRKEYVQCLKQYESDADHWKKFFCGQKKRSFTECKEFPKWVETSKEFDKWLLQMATEKKKGV